MTSIKYVDTKVVFAEIPDEITLAINISGCPCDCKGCHSPHLKEDIGEVLDTTSLDKLIEDNKGITCVSFMGGDAQPGEINRLASYVKTKGLKSAWYSGRNVISRRVDISNFDYIKVGPYIEELGPINSETSNQRLYQVVLWKYDGQDSPTLNNITNKLRK